MIMKFDLNSKECFAAEKAIDLANRNIIYLYDKTREDVLMYCALNTGKRYDELNNEFYITTNIKSEYN